MSEEVKYPPVTIRWELAQDLYSYGSLEPVTGVLYSQSHKDALDELSRTMVAAIADPAPQPATSTVEVEMVWTDADTMARVAQYGTVWRARLTSKPYLDAVALVPASVLSAALEDKKRAVDALTASRAKHGIYIASKTKHAARWRGLRDSGWPITSTWIDEAGAGESQDLNDLWHRCLDEASNAAAIVVYREPDDVLKGGWVELGAAASHGVPVFAVGLREFTISKHDGIQHFDTLDDALGAALKASQS